MCNKPLFPLDVIRMAGNEMSWTVTGPDPVRVESKQAGGRVDLPLADILTIIF